MCRFTILLLLLLTACAASPSTEVPTKPGPGRFDVSNIFFNDGDAKLGSNVRGYEEYRRMQDDATTVYIPGGYFWQRGYWDVPGTDMTDEGKWTYVPAMLIDKYEVTNAQVAQFINSRDGSFHSGGMPGARLESDAVFGPDNKPWAIEHPWGLRMSRRGVQPQPGYENHPAVGCSGWLALAYARGMGGDLPTAVQWEKAAGGPSGLLFPWGNEDRLPDSTRANSYLHGPRKTMPVGSYPDGTSPYGLLDMAGNVYERCYWGELRSADPDDDSVLPTMLKGGSWVSPNWSNLRCVDRCGQPMDAMDGSVGFRVCAPVPKHMIRDLTGGPKLRVVTDTLEAYDEAQARNVPIFLYLGYERCGQCDRVQAEVFTDPGFVEYCNNNVVVLIGHNRRYFNDMPKTPLAPDGTFFAHYGVKLEAIEQVWEDFSLQRTRRLVPLPDSVPLFQISPGMYLLNPHRQQIRNPDDAVLIDDREFMGHKTGGSVDHLLQLIGKAQQWLGAGQSLADFNAGKDAPETTWQPTPEDAAMWQKAKARMDEVVAALELFKREWGDYPEEYEELRDYFRRGWLPQDPFMGDYFRYRRTETGYTLTCYGAGDLPGGDEIPEQDIEVVKE